MGRVGVFQGQPLVKPVFGVRERRRDQNAVVSKAWDGDGDEQGFYCLDRTGDILEPLLDQVTSWQV